MSKRPWFADRGIGTLPMPASVKGWASLAAFILLVLMTDLSHSPVMWAFRVVLGVGYCGLVFAKSDRASR